MTEAHILQGRQIGTAELEQIRQFLAEYPHWSRWQLSRELALLWSWRNQAGQLKDMAARALLLKLEQRGWIDLPARRRTPSNRMRHKRLPESPWFYRALVLAGPLSVVALICGWVTTEVGRQPWVVYRVMRTSDAVTGAGGIPVGYATLALVYLGLALAVAWILRRLARVPLNAPPTAKEV